MNNQRTVIYNLLNSIKSDNYFLKFKYSSEFMKNWVNFCDSKEEVIYRNKEEKEDDQVYNYNINIGTDQLIFDFSIRYLNGLYKYDPNSAQEIILKYSDGLFHDQYKCFYTHIPDGELTSSEKYNDLDKIYVIPFLQKDYQFMVIDGNHRVCSMINEGKKDFSVLYFNEEQAALSLSTPLQFCAYCINQDYWKIKYNLGKKDDKVVWNGLNINNKHLLDIMNQRTK